MTGSTAVTLATDYNGKLIYFHATISFLAGFDSLMSNINENQGRLRKTLALLLLLVIVLLYLYT